MARYRRANADGACYFFTVVTERRQRILTEPDIRAALRDAIEKVRIKRPFQIDGWVLLPDHLHAIWTLPPGDADFSTRWRLIKARFSRGLPVGALRASHVKRHERGIWQRRFWEHHIRDEADMAAHLRYCWWNPVKHGFVTQPEDWPYTSHHRDVVDQT